MNEKIIKLLFGFLIIFTNYMKFMIADEYPPFMFLKITKADKTQSFRLTPYDTIEGEDAPNATVEILCACPVQYDETLKMDLSAYSKLNAIHLLKVKSEGEECKKLRCREPVRSVFLPNDFVNVVNCDAGGKISDMGFEVFLKRFTGYPNVIKKLSLSLSELLGGTNEYALWFNMLSVCSHSTTGTIYLKHTIKFPNLLEINDVSVEQEKQIDHFKYRWDLCIHKSLQQLYDKANQKNKIPNSGTYAGRYFVMKQLVEEDDMVIDMWKDATYQYFNTIPMWDTIGRGGWKKINNVIREKVKNVLHNHDITIYSGKSKDVLYMNGQPIILTDGELNHPVSKYYWKVVHDEQLKRGIAIIMHNDLEFSKPKNFSDHMVCKNVGLMCKENGWDAVSNTNNKSGYTYCCELTKEVRKTLRLSQAIKGNVQLLDILDRQELRKKLEATYSRRFFSQYATQISPVYYTSDDEEARNKAKEKFIREIEIQ